jgi:hypothetical protein
MFAVRCSGAGSYEVQTQASTASGVVFVFRLRPVRYMNAMLAPKIKYLARYRIFAFQGSL